MKMRWALVALMAALVVVMIGCPPQNARVWEEWWWSDEESDIRHEDGNVTVTIETPAPTVNEILIVNGLEFRGEVCELSPGAGFCVDLADRIVGGESPFTIEWLIDGQVVERGWRFCREHIDAPFRLVIRITDARGRVVERVLVIVIVIHPGDGNGNDNGADNGNDNGSGNDNQNQNQNDNQNGNDNSSNGNGNDNGGNGNGNDNGPGVILANWVEPTDNATFRVGQTVHLRLEVEGMQGPLTVHWLLADGTSFDTNSLELDHVFTFPLFQTSYAQVRDSANQTAEVWKVIRITN